MTEFDDTYLFHSEQVTINLPTHFDYENKEKKKKEN